MAEEDTTVCYHCDQPASGGLVECQRWGLYACLKCIAAFHQKAHANCDLSTEEKAAIYVQRKRRRCTFEVLLTGFNGNKIPVLCHVGSSFKMERHRAEGAYLYHSGGLFWTRETREELNLIVVHALASHFP